MPDTPFRTPDEWRRAREAFVVASNTCNCDDAPCPENRDKQRYIFTMHYPCPPEPVTLQWPTGLCAQFIPATGKFVGVRGPIGPGETVYCIYDHIPCRVVPADSVVLTREEAEGVDRIVQDLIDEEAPQIRAALRREREGKDETC